MKQFEEKEEAVMCMQCGCLVDANKKTSHVKFHKKIERLVNELEQLEQQKP